MINQIDECFKMRGSGGGSGYRDGTRGPCVHVAGSRYSEARSKVIVQMELNTEVWD